MVHSMGEVDPTLRGMSTTASVVQFVGELIIVGQVGDSRVYLARTARSPSSPRTTPGSTFKSSTVA